MSAHTKAPWFVQLRTQESPLICYQGDMAPPPALAEVLPIDVDDLGIETLANANVLAAAPDLLEALRAVCDHYVDVNAPFTDDDERRVVALADRAMAKAGGRETGRASWDRKRTIRITIPDIAKVVIEEVGGALTVKAQADDEHLVAWVPLTQGEHYEVEVETVPVADEGELTKEQDDDSQAGFQ